MNEYDVGEATEPFTNMNLSCSFIAKLLPPPTNLLHGECHSLLEASDSILCSIDDGRWFRDDRSSVEVAARRAMAMHVQLMTKALSTV